MNRPYPVLHFTASLLLSNFDLAFPPVSSPKASPRIFYKALPATRLVIFSQRERVCCLTHLRAPLRSDFGRLAVSPAGLELRQPLLQRARAIDVH